MTLGERLREERERLALSQPNFAALAGTTKQTLFSWESGKTAPDGFQLSALAGHGVDVLYVVSGERSTSQPAHDAAEHVLLQCYRKCELPAQQHLIQTAALLSAGLQADPSVRNALAHSRGSMSNSGSGAVQVGSAGGKVVIKKGR